MTFTQYTTPNNKPSSRCTALLYKLMKENQKYGDLLMTRAGFSYVLSRLMGQKSDFMTLYERMGDSKHTYKQWAMLYAIGKQKSFDYHCYLELVAELLGTTYKPLSTN